MDGQRMRSPLARARGLGSARDGVEHWWMQRLTAVALIPLTLWFAASLIALTGSDYNAFIAWLKAPFVAILMVLLLIAHCEGSRCTTPAEAVMTRDVTYCHPSDPLHDVLSKMKERGFVHVPIVDQESKPIGVINARDVLQVLLEDVEYDVSFLRDYVT